MDECNAQMGRCNARMGRCNAQMDECNARKMRCNASMDECNARMDIFSTSKDKMAIFDQILLDFRIQPFRRLKSFFYLFIRWLSVIGWIF